MDLPAAAKLVQQNFGYAFILVAIVIGGWREWYIWGPTHKREVDDLRLQLVEARTREKTANDRSDQFLQMAWSATHAAEEMGVIAKKTVLELPKFGGGT